MSKELEALEKIKNIKTLSVPERRVVTFQEKYKKELDIIETALKKQEQDQKKVKALEIIKEKKVDTLLLFRCFEFDNLYGYPHFEMYNQELYTQNITKNEYELLKEVLL